MTNEFQTRRSWNRPHLHLGIRDGDERAPRKNLLEYALDIVTMKSLREQVTNLLQLKSSLFNDTTKYILWWVNSMIIIYFLKAIWIEK